MSNLSDFLIDLALNPQMQEVVERNPEAMMAVTGLSERDKMALNTGNRAKVTAAFADDLGTNELTAVVGGCLFSDPGPDPAPDPDPLPEGD